MSMNDNIADMLTRIRNSALRRNQSVIFPASKLKLAILKVLHEEGFVGEYTQSQDGQITVELKYYPNMKQSVIRKIQRVSRPGLRIYKNHNELPPVMSGQGIYVVSTSQGVVSDHFCRANKIGGEVLCMIY